MHICYVDESGDLGALPSPTSEKVQPLLVVAGAFVAQPRLRDLTHDFIGLKRTFFPGRHAPLQFYLDSVLIEVKGAELRKNVASASRREWRHALGVLDKFLSLLESYEVKLVGHVWVKPIGGKFDGRATYTRTIQDICADFQHFLEREDSAGMVIADCRDLEKDRYVAHSVFTQKYKAAGDAYPNIQEMPTFGRSNNHVGIQIADLLCSALIWPIAIHTYCEGHLHSVHVRPDYQRVKERFAGRLRDLQYRYRVGSRLQGGLAVTDGIAGRSGRWLFQT